jgi:hypothetical protein
LGIVFENATLTLREICNKIIHASDFRPVYHNDDRDRDEPSVWGMTGEIEIQGTHQKMDWSISIYVNSFLDACLAWVGDDGDDEKLDKAEISKG